MRLLIIIYVLSLTAVSAWAQDSIETPVETSTPRQVIVDDLEQQAHPDVLLELRGASETKKENTPQSEPETEVESAEEILEDLALSADERNSSPALAPFYLNASDYVTARADGKHNQLVLNYEVETSSLESDADPRVEKIQLLIGPDYVSVTSQKSQKIYDFKMNRYLEIKQVKTLANESETALHFDNISLYAKAYRNIATVRRATQNGQKRRIPIAEDQDIDSFWLESSMSWAAAKLENPLKIKSTISNVLAIWDEQGVISASFDGATYEDANFKNSLMAYAHHGWPIHPKILVEFYEYNAPPQSLEMLSYGPTKPKGQKQKWTLKNRDFSEGYFPLPINALSPVERRPISPLVFIISEAVENRAMGGMPSQEALEASFEQAAADGDPLTQWLIGQRHNAYFNTCQVDKNAEICIALTGLAETEKFAAIGAIDPKAKILSDYITAAGLAKVKKSRAKALFTLQPYLDEQDTPAFILRTAAMARASMKKADAEKSGMEAIRSESLLKQALAKDPYDPHTYVGLAQVYAANGAFEQSWDIYDTLRSAIPTASTTKLKIDQAESNLLLTGPGYFLQK